MRQGVVACPLVFIQADYVQSDHTLSIEEAACVIGRRVYRCGRDLWRRSWYLVLTLHPIALRLTV